MRITLIDPHVFSGFYMYNRGKKYNLHGYYIEFIKKYRPNIYITKAREYLRVRRFFKDINEEIDEFKVFYTSFSKKSLYSQTDVLIYMNGGVYSDSSLFKKFNGVKIYHIMDPQYLARKLNEFLVHAGVDYLFGYNSYDKYSEFVRLMYPSFQGRIIGIPFGFAPEWKVETPFEERRHKAILSGTMETFKAVRNSDYYNAVGDYFRFFSAKYNSMHEIRYMIDRDIPGYSHCVNSKILHWPSKDNFIEDIIGEFNKYKFFINDESLLNFCPIRTYEGIAAGCVMLAHEATCYDEWGFKDNQNCILFNKIEEIPEKIEYYLKNKRLLEKVQRDGLEYVRSNYNHVTIAKMLYSKIRGLYLE